MRDIRTGGGKVFQASGAPVVQADLLGLIIPDSRKALGLALATISLLVLLDVKSLRGTAVLILPLLFSLLWTLGALKVFGILIMPLFIVRKYQPTSQSSIPPDGRENHLFTDMIQTGSHPKKESIMPYVKITVTRKDIITAGQKRKLFEGVTRLLVEVLDKEPDLTHIVIEEVDPENWGVGGMPSPEYRKARGESGKAASHE